MEFYCVSMKFQVLRAHHFSKGLVTTLKVKIQFKVNKEKIQFKVNKVMIQFKVNKVKSKQSKDTV